MPIAPSADGVPVAYSALGGRGPAILFAHATGFHGHVWRPVAAQLADSFSTYVFDERGHGDTPASPSGQSWLGFALDALAVVDAAGLRRPYGVGHSAGGAALLLAELHRPGTFEALWLFEPILPPPEASRIPGAGAALAAGARRRREVFPDRQAAYDTYASKPPFSILEPDALRAYVDFGFDDLDDGQVRLKCRGEVEAATYEMSVEHGTAGRLEEIDCPVLLAAGALTETPFGPPMMELLADRLPAGRAEAFAGLGHFGPMERPAEVATSIRRWFSEVAP